MRSFIFEISGDPGVSIAARETDGNLNFNLQLQSISGKVADLRAIFFDIADDDLLSELTVTGPDVTSSLFNSAAVDTLGQDANVKGEIINNWGKFDGGVEFGTPGISTDDLKSVSFTLSHPTESLTLDLIGRQDFGARITSIGLDGGERSGSSKIGSRSTAAPDAIDDAWITNEDTKITFDVLLNDMDADSDELTVMGVTTTDTVGDVTLNADGTITYDPSGKFEHLGADETATDSFTYSVSDGNGGSDEATVAVTIDGVEDQTSDAVQWTVNSHWYEAILADGGITWDAAKAASEAAGGYLVTITSAEENAFVYALVADDLSFWSKPNVAGSLLGPWLGGVQDPTGAEPRTGWGWVTGEPWLYTNWGGSEPNNGSPSGPGGEDVMIFYRHPGQSNGDKWADNSADPGTVGQGTYVESYIVEYDERPASQDALDVLLV